MSRLPLTFAPSLSRLRGRLQLANTYKDCSDRSWTLSPGCERMQPPALFDPDDLKRVTGVPVDSTLEIQIERITPGLKPHRPTLAYLLKDVRMIDGHLFRNDMILRVAAGRVPWVGVGYPAERPQGVLAASHYGFKYFGHWVHDELPRGLAAAELGHAVTPQFTPTPHQEAYLDVCGLQAEGVSDTLFRELIVLDDVGQNDYKRQRLATLRARIRASRPFKPHEGVMLLRKRSGVNRVLANEAEIADSLAERGYRIAYPEELGIDEIFEACLGAKVVIGVEGSQIAHGLMCMEDGGTLVALQPPSRFNNVLMGLCDCMGLSYGFVVGEQAGNDFTVDIQRLHRLLDRIQPLSGS